MKKLKDLIALIIFIKRLIIWFSKNKTKLYLKKLLYIKRLIRSFKEFVNILKILIEPELSSIYKEWMNIIKNDITTKLSLNPCPIIYPQFFKYGL